MAIIGRLGGVLIGRPLIFWQPMRWCVIMEAIINDSVISGVVIDALLPDWPNHDKQFAYYNNLFIIFYISLWKIRKKIQKNSEKFWKIEKKCRKIRKKFSQHFRNFLLIFRIFPTFFRHFPVIFCNLHKTYSFIFFL